MYVKDLYAFNFTTHLGGPCTSSLFTLLSSAHVAALNPGLVLSLYQPYTVTGSEDLMGGELICNYGMTIPSPEAYYAASKTGSFVVYSNLTFNGDIEFNESLSLVGDTSVGLAGSFELVGKGTLNFTKNYYILSQLYIPPGVTVNVHADSEAVFGGGFTVEGNLSIISTVGRFNLTLPGSLSLSRGYACLQDINLCCVGNFFCQNSTFEFNVDTPNQTSNVFFGGGFVDSCSIKVKNELSNWNISYPLIDVIYNQVLSGNKATVSTTFDVLPQNAQKVLTAQSRTQILTFFNYIPTPAPTAEPSTINISNFYFPTYSNDSFQLLPSFLAFFAALLIFCL